MRNVMPFIPVGQSNASSAAKIYFYRGNESLDFQIRSAANGYRLDVIGGRGYVSVRAPNGRGIDRINIKDIHSSSPSVRLQSESNASRHDVELRSIVRLNEQIRVYKLEDIKVSQKVPVEFRLSSGGNALETMTRQSAISYNAILSTLGKQKMPSVTKHVELKKGQMLRLAPERWDRRHIQNLKIQKKELPSRLLQKK